MKAVILAGGVGTRLLPITETIPKPLILINDKPFLQYVIDELLHAGVTTICVVGCYKISQLNDFLANTYAQLVKEKRIVLVDQKKPLGTGHALLAAKSFCDKDDFIVLGGDNLFPKNDIVKLSSHSLSIASYTVVDWQKYGILHSDAGKLLSIVEKPKEFCGNNANGGLYKLTSDIWPYLEKIKPSARGEIEITDAINLLAKKKSFFIYHLSDWTDLGTLTDIDRIAEKFGETDTSEDFENKYFW